MQTVYVIDAVRTRSENTGALFPGTETRWFAGMWSRRCLSVKKALIPKGNWRCDRRSNQSKWEDNPECSSYGSFAGRFCPYLLLEIQLTGFAPAASGNNGQHPLPVGMQIDDRLWCKSMSRAPFVMGKANTPFDHNAQLFFTLPWAGVCKSKRRNVSYYRIPWVKQRRMLPNNGTSAGMPRWICLGK